MDQVNQQKCLCRIGIFRILVAADYQTRQTLAVRQLLKKIVLVRIRAITSPVAEF